jgi:hypothetical protein
MKVRELVELLQRCPQDAEVFTEGCDCEGDVVLVEIHRTGGSVLLCRSSEVEHGHPFEPSVVDRRPVERPYYAF